MADVRNTQEIFSAMLESRADRKEKSMRKLESKRLVREAIGAEMFTGRLLRESLENDQLDAELEVDAIQSNEDVVEDIIDNIVVVTDPDKSVEDLESRADDIQDAIEGSAEGEAAFSDEYVGDKVYACPICGESFFAEEDYKEGDACPVCKAEPTDGFLLQGVVAAVEPEEEEAIEEPEAVEEPVEEDEEPATEDEEVVEEPAAEDESEEDEVEIEDEEEPAQESYNRKNIAKEGIFGGSNSKSAVKSQFKALSANPGKFVANPSDDDMFFNVEIKDKNGFRNELDRLGYQQIKPNIYGKEVDGAKVVAMIDGDKARISGDKNDVKYMKECDEPAVEVEIEVNIPSAEEPECDSVVPGVELDETSFDACLNEFADENYGDCLDSLEVEEVTYCPEDDILKMECKATTKGGATVPVLFEMKEESCKDNKATLIAKESTNVFKVESKKPAFKFEVSRIGGAIVCEALKYGYITTHSKAGKVKVEGLARRKTNR